MRFAALCAYLVAAACSGDSTAAQADAGADAQPSVDGGTNPAFFLCGLERRSISDQTLERKEIRTRSPAGGLGSQDIDSDGDGIYEVRRFYSYNTDGLKISEEDDLGLDGTIDVFRYFYIDSATGRTLYYLIDLDVASINGFEIQWIFNYDGDGNLFEWRRDDTPDPLTDETVAEDPGLSELRTFEFDAEGREISRTFDRQYDGSDNYHETRSYDEAGRLVDQQLDDPGGNNPIDGTVDSVWSWDYDEIGRVVQRLFDADNDGTFDVREQRFYDCE